MVREARLQLALAPQGIRLPPILAICDDEGVLDEGATAETRQRFRDQRGIPEVFDFGPVPERFTYPAGFDLERART